METQSIFTMDNVREVLTMPIQEAKRYALGIVTDDQNAKPVTKVKARQMIGKCTRTDKLAFAMSSWILAHPSENLKVVKVLAAGTM